MACPGINSAVIFTGSELGTVGMTAVQAGQAGYDPMVAAHRRGPGGPGAS
ncbi:MAG: hypothetical protein ACYCXA_00300 [Actinomycetes bacterium]